MLESKEESNLIVRLEDGEDLFQSLERLNIVSGVILNGVGQLRELRLGFWLNKKKVYQEIEVEGPVELLSLQGNLSFKNDESIIHCHAILGDEEGKTLGGHVIEATVNLTNEIFITKFEQIKMRRKEEPSGLTGLYPEI